MGLQMSDGERSTSSEKRMKILRLTDAYDLNEIGHEMERLWTASGENRLSLRDLADYFNQHLLEAAMANVGMQPLSGEVENIYQLLTGDDVSEAERTRARRRLEREGVDVESLLTDFVTYQAVRTYLMKHRGAEYTPDDRDRTVVETENIQRLRGRIAKVTDSKLKQLRNSDDLYLGEYRTLVDINVLCENCSGQYGIEELLERGGCDCAETIET